MPSNFDVGDDNMDSELVNCFLVGCSNVLRCCSNVVVNKLYKHVEVNHLLVWLLSLGSKTTFNQLINTLMWYFCIFVASKNNKIEFTFCANQFLSLCLLLRILESLQKTWVDALLCDDTSKRTYHNLVHLHIMKDVKRSTGNSTCCLNNYCSIQETKHSILEVIYFLLLFLCYCKDSGVNIRGSHYYHIIVGHLSFAFLDQYSFFFISDHLKKTYSPPTNTKNEPQFVCWCRWKSTHPTL